MEHCAPPFLPFISGIKPQPEDVDLGLEVELEEDIGMQIAMERVECERAHERVSCVVGIVFQDIIATVQDEIKSATATGCATQCN
jgi:hypothetical protein